MTAELAPQPGELILDLAAGTGTSSFPLAQPGVHVVAADFSLGMLRVGRNRRPGLEFCAADATKLPFAAASFDAVTMSFGLRNVLEVDLALAELFRVTKPGGRLLICEFSQPTHPILRTGYQRYLLRALPAIARRVSSNPQSYEYLSESIAAWPAQAELARRVAQAGWQAPAWRNLTSGIVALHRGYKTV